MSCRVGGGVPGQVILRFRLVERRLRAVRWEGAAEAGRKDQKASVTDGLFENIDRFAYAKVAGVEDEGILGEHDAVRHSSVARKCSERFNAGLSGVRVNEDDGAAGAGFYDCHFDSADPQATPVVFVAQILLALPRRSRRQPVIGILLHARHRSHLSGKRSNAYARCAP